MTDSGNRCTIAGTSSFMPPGASGCKYITLNTIDQCVYRRGCP